jgi:iron only hydrogenase large subunit-like protein
LSILSVTEKKLISFQHMGDYFSERNEKKKKENKPVPCSCCPLTVQHEDSFLEKCAG